MQDQIKQYLSQIGKKGGSNSRKNLSPERRREIAKKAVEARIKKLGQKRRLSTTL